jgi:hypothetical protein
MELYYNGYSNVPAWIEYANLENTNTLVWHTFHQRYWKYDELIKTPRWKEADRIFLVGQEGDIDGWIKHDSRIYVWDSLVKPNAERFFSYFWWWWQTNEVNQSQRLTDRLTNPLVDRPKYVFDCMMGGKRPHRNFIYHLILNSGINQHCLLNYGQYWISGVDNDSEENLRKYKLAENFSGNLSGTMFPFKNQQSANISTWVPWKIYNQSWFSVVAETDHQRRFFTEKTAKVLLGKKLFIFIGAAGALQDLKNLGFKTFSSVIDESYDSVLNDQKRWELAFEQMQFLCSQRPEDVYLKILPVLEHNQQLMLDIDWNKCAVAEMQKIVHGH